MFFSKTERPREIYRCLRAMARLAITSARATFRVSSVAGLASSPFRHVVAEHKFSGCVLRSWGRKRCVYRSCGKRVSPLAGRDLQDADLSHAKDAGANLPGANLTGASHDSPSD